MRNAKEVLELHLWGMEEDDDIIPSASKPEEIKLETGEFILPVCVYMAPVREEMNNKAVKKTLTIPYWLNKIAEEQKVNFSAILQKSLKENLGIK